MKKIMLELGRGRAVGCNYVEKILEMTGGLFLDCSKPLLMRIPLWAHPIFISTKDRGEHILPEITVLTFDKRFDRVRIFKNMKSNGVARVRVWFREKYVLEIPMDNPKDSHYKLIDEMLCLKKLKYREG